MEALLRFHHKITHDNPAVFQLHPATTQISQFTMFDCPQPIAQFSQFIVFDCPQATHALLLFIIIPLRTSRLFHHVETFICAEFSLSLLRNSENKEIL